VAARHPNIKQATGIAHRGKSFPSLATDYAFPPIKQAWGSSDLIPYTQRTLVILARRARALRESRIMKSLTTHELYGPRCPQKPSPARSVRRAKPADLPAIVQLHLISLPHFFLTRPGPAFLRCFYSFVLRDRRGLLFVSEQEESLVGFAAGFTDPSRLYPKPPVGRFRFLAAATACLIRYPVEFPGLFNDFRQASRLKQQSDADSRPVCELITIAVQPQFRHQGHGKSLACTLIEAARGTGSHVRVRIESSDAGMMFFYRRLGFEPFRAFRASDSRCMDEYVLPSQKQ
jgi:ribosomal protein S18 acetylase RimI-like enzyme